MHGTRSMTVALLALVGAFLCVAIYVATDGGAHASIPTRSLSASVFMSAEEDVPMGPVIVGEDDTRARMGLRLRESLRGVIADGALAPTIAQTHDDASPKNDTHAPISLSVHDADCRPYSSFLSGVWGPVSVAVDGTNRVLTSTVRGDDGLPLHTLVLPKTPVRTDRPVCVSQGGIALLLDGTVLMKERPYTAPQDGLIGFAIDGFPIYGSIEEEKVVSSSDLDTCSGHTHGVMLDEAFVSQYHHHLTDDATGLECVYGTPPH